VHPPEGVQKRRSKPPLCDDDEVIVGCKLNIPELRAMERNGVVKNDLNSTLKSLLGMESLRHLLDQHENLVTACGLWPRSLTSEARRRSSDPTAAMP